MTRQAVSVYRMNLIKDPWIAVRCKSGSETLIAPWQLTEAHDPVIALSTPRPDFNGALMQFLIGLLQTAATPDDNNCWLDWLESPPNPEQLKACFERYAYAFELKAEKGAFMQDFDELDTDTQAIEKLLIDSPGGKTLKDNTDHFVKRERIKHICPGCAATALLSLQVNAPSGGVGHRTSLRGGGPLTTLVILDENSDLPADLWRNLWLNVLEKSEIANLTGNKGKTAPADIFPWLAKTRTSETNSGKETTPIDINPLQMYWGMPRRIRIHWQSDNNISNAEYCDLCGEASDELINHYQTQNYGINYTGAWQHPLSPYRLDNTGNLLPRHVQPAGLSYQHWLSMIEDDENNFSSEVVKRYQNLGWDKEQFRLYAFGYDMDNMKARCWYEATFPLYTIPDVIRVAFSKRVQTLTETAAEFAGFIQRNVKEAWFKRPGDAKGDTTFLKQIFYEHTESAFYQAVKELQTRLSNGTGTDVDVLREWHGTLRSSALDLFDYWSTCGDFTQANPRRIAEAREKLKRQIYSKNIRQKLQLTNKMTEAA